MTRKILWGSKEAGEPAPKREDEKEDEKKDWKKSLFGISSKTEAKKTEAGSYATDELNLPIRPAPPPYSPSEPNADSDVNVDDGDNKPQDRASSGLQLTLHPSSTPEPGVLVRLTPPQRPSTDVVGDESGHVACDIVLVIDVSGSMGGAAPVPGAGAEDFGLSVLDLVKHAAATIIATLDERDRLGIVVFSTTSEIVQPLTPMTPSNKAETAAHVAALKPKASTNLWHGIRDGLALFDGQASSGRAPAVMVLTDGMPNEKCPPQGYVPKLRTMFPLPAAIHTFGFGYYLRSGLLKSIAEIGSGNYAFIPDAGMIGTVFVHAVANLQSTYAKSAVLTISYPNDLALEETTGESVEQQKPVPASSVADGRSTMTVKLGNIQYGQSRDIWLRVSEHGDAAHLAVELLGAEVDLTLVGHDEPHRCFVPQSNPAAIAPLPLSTFAYHRGRSALVAFLASLFPTNNVGEHEAPANPPSQQKTAVVLDKLLSLLTDPDERVQSIRRDIVLDNNTDGQVRLALADAASFQRWGKHYLPSLANAHLRQICNSFKDPGPLAYCTDSPLFVACRDRLDDAFDSLPAPKPSVHNGYVSSGLSINMSSYNQSHGPCFAGATPVRLASGASKPIRDLRRRDRVETPIGSREVVAVLRTRVHRAVMARVDNFLVTPWHPVSADAKSWQFPAKVPGRGRVRYTGCIYSILLASDADPAAHAIHVGAGYWGVTLGHGIVANTGESTSARDDVRAHPFLGSYDKVFAELKRLKIGAGGVVDGAGVKRDRVSRKVIGFKRLPRQRPGLAEAALELALMTDGKHIPSQVLRGPPRRIIRVRIVRARPTLRNQRRVRC